MLARIVNSLPNRLSQQLTKIYFQGIYQILTLGDNWICISYLYLLSV